MIILKWIFKTCAGEAWTGLDWPGLAKDMDGSQTMSPLIFNCLCARNFQIVQILSQLPYRTVPYPVRTKLCVCV
jgi:hypothetical protein